MNSLFKDVTGFFKFIQSLFFGVGKFFTPKKAFSWQTFLYLSIYSLGLSSLATSPVKEIIAFGGWLFLIAGTAWYTTDDPLRVPGTFMPVGALITGFLVSVFAFGHEESVVTTRTIVLWPTIAALITAIPEFFVSGGLTPKAQLPKLQGRQKVIILLGWSMLISCWIQFYFVIDKWIKEYPSLQADNFQNSTFVIRVETKVNIPRNGKIILDKLQPLVERQLSNQSWSNVERWLLSANQNVGNLSRDIITKDLVKYEEQGLWRVEPRVTNVKSGYRLDILSIWTGPSSKQQGYYLQNSCLIQPVTAPNNSRIRGIVASVKCDRPSKLMDGPPPPQQ
ncbi:MAG TPA: septal junction protein FraD [Nostocaceae cyanobacterium]|nr:septal junction protein FraD [Nostocaceae cyanobacterium]